MTLYALMKDLARNGGAVVVSEACSEIELTMAQNEGRIGIAEDGRCFVRRPLQWLMSADLLMLECARAADIQ